MGIGTPVAVAAPGTGFPSKPLWLIALGASAPVVLKKLTQWAQTTVVAIAKSEIKSSGDNATMPAPDEQAAGSQ